MGGARCNADRTAVKRHSPQQTCPHGVAVAFIGGEKHIGHEYSERGTEVTVGTDGAAELDDEELDSAADKAASSPGRRMNSTSSSDEETSAVAADVDDEGPAVERHHF